MKFLEFLSTGLCYFCIRQKMKKEKEECYGGLVKFAKKVLDGLYAQAHHDVDDDIDDSISSEELDCKNLEYWKENFTDPPLFSHSLNSL